jgi:hypothetical protein
MPLPKLAARCSGSPLANCKEVLLWCLSGTGNSAEGLCNTAGGDTLIPGLHSRCYSARRSAHAVVSAPPKGRRRQACAIRTHRKEPHSAPASD